MPSLLRTRRAVAFAAVMLAALPANARAQQTVELDLAVAQTQTRPAPGPDIQFVIVNRMPRKHYTISIVDRIMEVDPLPALGPRLGLQPQCVELLARAEKLAATPEKDGPTDEAEVGTRVSDITAALANDECKDSMTVQSIRDRLSKTRLPVPGVFHVADGHELVLTVSRVDGDKALTWTLTVQGVSRGKWITTYGLAFVPDRDEKFFTATTGGTQFTITAESRRGGLKVLPAVFFTWLPRRRQDKDLVVGPTAGFGLEGGNRPAAFGGVGLTYNWNLGFVAGIGIVPEQRLAGRYAPGQVVDADLAVEALHTTVVQARWLFAFTYRFGSNPFEKAPAAATAGEK